MAHFWREGGLCVLLRSSKRRRAGFCEVLEASARRAACSLTRRARTPRCRWTASCSGLAWSSVSNCNARPFDGNQPRRRAMRPAHRHGGELQRHRQRGVPRLRHRVDAGGVHRSYRRRPGGRVVTRGVRGGRLRVQGACGGRRRVTARRGGHPRLALSCGLLGCRKSWSEEVEAASCICLKHRSVEAGALCAAL